MQPMSWDPYGQGSPLILFLEELAHSICRKGLLPPAGMVLLGTETVLAHAPKQERGCKLYSSLPVGFHTTIPHLRGGERVSVAPCFGDC